MEEDIKVLEEFINNYKSIQEKYKDDEIQAEIERSCYFEEVPAQAIENLIARNKELEELLDKRLWDEHISNLQEENARQHELLCNIHEKYQKDYIPKLKVREKIEELKGKIEYYKKCANIAKDRVEKRLMCDQINELKTAIKYFEQLLQEGDK